jgi:phosphomannomutase / phosphoglucomutase
MEGCLVTLINTINGIRFGLESGSWGLVRASSNKPELVVVCESMKSEADMKSVFVMIRSLLKLDPAVGAFNQEI